MSAPTPLEAARDRFLADARQLAPVHLAVSDREGAFRDELLDLAHTLLD